MLALSRLTDEDREQITKQIAQLKFIVDAMRKDVKNPKKPLRKRVSKKYKKIQDDYIDTIEQLNKRNEMFLLALDIIIVIHEKLILG